MKKLLVSMVAALSLALFACTSVETAKVNAGEIASSSDAVAVVQATEFGLSIIFGFVPLAKASLDDVVNKTLVAEAKALGGNKVEIVTMGGLHPDQFPFNMNLVNPTVMMAAGVAVK